jgi:hypothetical protein
VVEQRSPKPLVQVRFLVGPQRKTALAGGCELLLHLFKEDILFEGRVELLKLDFALDALLVLTSPDNVIGLRRTELE